MTWKITSYGHIDAKLAKISIETFDSIISSTIRAIRNSVEPLNITEISGLTGHNTKLVGIALSELFRQKEVAHIKRYPKKMSNADVKKNLNRMCVANGQRVPTKKQIEDAYLEKQRINKNNDVRYRALNSSNLCFSFMVELN